MAMDWPKRLQPSSLNQHFVYKSQTFAEYIAETREMIKNARLDLTDSTQDFIVQANSPAEWIPHIGKVKNGILLIHGLCDSPHAMQSLFDHYKAKGFLVRSILLPCHGSVPGDLVEIKL